METSGGRYVITFTITTNFFDIVKVLDLLIVKSNMALGQTEERIERIYDVANKNVQ